MSSPEKIPSNLACSNGQASSEVTFGSEKTLAACELGPNSVERGVKAPFTEGGPKKLGACRLEAPGQSDVACSTPVAPPTLACAAFSSRFFSRNARPPCLRSRPLIDLLNVLPGAGEAGANEYRDCGALGSVGLELLEADESGKL